MTSSCGIFSAAPTNWALEVNTFLLVFLCVIPAADVLRLGVQIRITFLTERLSARTRDRLEILRAMAGFLFLRGDDLEGGGHGPARLAAQRPHVHVLRNPDGDSLPLSAHRFRSSWHPISDIPHWEEKENRSDRRATSRGAGSRDRTADLKRELRIEGFGN